MRIGYSKIGRNMPLSQDSWGFVGGDDEPPLLLKDLAERNPQHTFVLCGRNSGENPQDIGFPSNVENPWTEWRKLYREAGKSLEDRSARTAWFDTHVLPTFRDLDQHIVWLGQHGTSNTPIPKIGEGWDGELTDPQDSFMQYVAYILRGLNAWRSKQVHSLLDTDKEEIYVIADGRNHHKARDAKWPVTKPIIAQYNQTRTGKYERYNDWNPPETYGFTGKTENNGRVWLVKQTYVYSRLEICGILPWHIDSEFNGNWEGRQHFGLFINEARKQNSPKARMPILRDWALPLDPAFVHGKWSEESQADLNRTIEPAPWDQYYPLIRSVRTTFTTPSSLTGWATTKPWQAFAVGTVCFFHPWYDTQNNILGDAHPDLKKWLRVESPEDLRKRVEYLNDPSGKQAWAWLVHEQRKHYDKACTELRHLKMIEERLT